MDMQKPKVHSDFPRISADCLIISDDVLKQCFSHGFIGFPLSSLVFLVVLLVFPILALLSIGLNLLPMVFLTFSCGFPVIFWDAVFVGGLMQHIRIVRNFGAGIS